MLDLDASCRYARPRAASSVSFSRVDQLTGILPGPLFPVTTRISLKGVLNHQFDFLGLFCQLKYFKLVMFLL